MQNNTGYNWTMRGGAPQTSGKQDRVLVARSPCGRVEVEVHQDVGGFWNPLSSDHEEGTHYIVSVYASNSYTYYPQHDDGEWTDYELVAHLRPSNNGQGWAPSFSVARNLVLNGVIAIEEKDKWISGSLNDSHREFVNPSMSEEEALKQLRGMFRATTTNTERVTRDEALELAQEYDEWSLAEYIYSLTNDDFHWMLMDIETKGVTNPV